MTFKIKRKKTKEKTNKPFLVAGRLQNHPVEHQKLWFDKGIMMLKKKKKEDSPHFKLRVVDEERGIWIIEDGNAITLLDRKDY